MESSEQFCFTTTENEINKAMKSVVLVNAATSTKWAVKNFTDWVNKSQKN